MNNIQGWSLVEPYSPSRKVLSRQAAVVALIGPRQVGNTAQAHTVAEGTYSVYLDLEAREDRAKLYDQYEDQLVVLDEIHRVPELFPALLGTHTRLGFDAFDAAVQ